MSERRLQSEPVPKAASPVPPTRFALPIGAALALVAINVLWGASSVAAKTCLESFGPFTLSFARFFPAGLILLGLCRMNDLPLGIPRREWPAFAFYSLVGISLTYSIYYTGVAHTTATDASLLFACEPILIAVFAVLFLRERLSGRQWLGMGVGVAGIWLLAGHGMGNLLALLALCCESSTGIFAKRFSSRYPGLVVVGTQMIVGALLLLPFALGELVHRTPVVTAQAVGSLLYLSLICSAVCYGVWYHLLVRHPLSLMGAFILVQPLVGPLFGRLLRGERLPISSAAGGLLVISGIVLTALARSARSRPSDSPVPDTPSPSSPR